MQITMNSEQIEFKTMPITEQLLLLVDSETDLNETPKFKDKKHNAIIGSLLADLFLMKKIGLVNNKVLVTTSDTSRINYLNNFLNKLRSLGERKLMEDIIHEVKPLAENVEQDVMKKLLAEEWLVEKKGFIPFISQKELQIESSDFLKALKSTITDILANKQEPDKGHVYLMAILHAINMLKNFNKGGKLGKEEISRLNELMNQEYLTKLLYNAIKNQPDPKSLKFIDIAPPGYMAGVGGLLTK